MKRQVFRAALAPLCVVMLFATSAPGQSSSVVRIVERYADSVVAIESGGAHGTGFFTDFHGVGDRRWRDGLIVTNAHVVLAGGVVADGRRAAPPGTSSTSTRAATSPSSARPSPACADPSSRAVSRSARG